jgi:hypothetical protein
MKKLKRTSSTGVHKSSRKNLSQVKINSAAVLKSKPKKIFREVAEKENILIVEDHKYPKGQTGSKKKPSQKNKRSKSMLYEKRMVMTKVDTTHNSSRVNDNVTPLLQAEIREVVEFSADMASIR